MLLTKIFKIRNTQAVHIPAELAFARFDIDYEIERIGNELRIRPAPRSLAEVMSKFAAFSEDFMDED
ncbi:MAG: AbrB family transcriptional regulator [Pseudomonadota bacterium]